MVARTTPFLGTPGSSSVWFWATDSIILVMAICSVVMAVIFGVPDIVRWYIGRDWLKCWSLKEDADFSMSWSDMRTPEGSMIESQQCSLNCWDCCLKSFCSLCLRSNTRLLKSLFMLRLKRCPLFYAIQVFVCPQSRQVEFILTFCPRGPRAANLP